MMTGKWTCLAVLLFTASLASGCSSIPEKLKFAKKDEAKSTKVVDELNRPVGFHLSYAQWQEETGNLPEASESYRIVLTKEPQNIKAQLGLARVSMKAGELEQAEALFTEVLKVAPGDHEVLDSLGQFYAEKKDWPRSVAMLDQAVRLQPENKTYRYHYAAALAHFGKGPEALTEFQKILTESESHYALAHILKKQGNWQGADYHVQRSLALNPKSPEARKLYDDLKYAGGVHTRYAEHSAPSGTPRTLPTGYEQRTAQPASSGQYPGTFEYHEEKINPVDF